MKLGRYSMDAKLAGLDNLIREYDFLELLTIADECNMLEEYEARMIACFGDGGFIPSSLIGSFSWPDETWMRLDDVIKSHKQVQKIWNSANNWMKSSDRGAELAYNNYYGLKAEVEREVFLLGGGK